jgi:hypothetical protein
MTLRGVGALAVLVYAAALNQVPAQTTVEVEAGKGVTIASQDGDTKINIGFYGQFRFQELSRDIWRKSDILQTFPDPVTGFAVENDGRTEPSFQVRRLRLVAQGSLWKSWIRYVLEVDLAGNDEGLRSIFIPAQTCSEGLCDFPGVSVSQGAQEQDGRTLKLLDWYVDLAPIAAARARIGQFKVPFGRQELVSDNRLQMTSRGIASDFFAPGRDRGVMFHGGTDTQKVQYKVGLFNGTGLAQTQNIDKSLAYAARLTATSSGPYLDVESVVDQPPSLGVRFQGGVAWYQSTDTPFRLDPVTPESDVRNTRLEGDVGLFFRQRGNLFLEYYQRKIEVEQNFDLPPSCYGAFIQGRFSCDQSGYTVQGGLRLGPTDHHELSARYSWIDNDRDLDDDERLEATLNYTYFFFRHTMQLSASISGYKLGVNAQGSSGFAVKLANTAVSFLDDVAWQGLQADENILGTLQFQWTF